MHYHNITKSDMLNGSGLRVVLWLSGCDHNCYNCQNPQTHDCNSGIPFDLSAKEEIFQELEKDYIKGITFSGGDPLHQNNIYEVLHLILEIKEKYKTKDIWVYSGYTWDEIFVSLDSRTMTEEVQNEVRKKIILLSDVFVDGRYIEYLKDNKYQWAGSTNQRVIDVKKTLESGYIILKE